MTTPERQYTVYTFWSRGERLKVSYIRAYTKWAHPQWADCVTYQVTASSGEEAKRKAKRLRLEHERNKQGV